VLQDLDAVEALIQGLLVFQGGVLMVRRQDVSISQCSVNNLVGVCAQWRRVSDDWFAGESRRASHHWKRGRALGGVRGQGDPILRHVQGLQEAAQALDEPGECLSSVHRR